jgi:hypothetical protein
VLTHRRHRLNGAFETVERVPGQQLSPQSSCRNRCRKLRISP